MSFDAYRLITITKVDPVTPLLKREVWEVQVHLTKVVLQSYRQEQRQTNRHKWRAELFWSTHSPRHSTIKEPEFPVWVAEQALLEFVRQFVTTPKEMHLRRDGNWRDSEIGKVEYPKNLFFEGVAQ